MSKKIFHFALIQICQYIFKSIKILNLSDLIYELYVLNHDFPTI